MSRNHQLPAEETKSRHLALRPRASGATVRLAPVGRRGVAACRSLRGHGNAVSEGWYLFTSQDQFHACADSDDLRFTDPHLLSRLSAEFESALAISAQADLDMRDG